MKIPKSVSISKKLFTQLQHLEDFPISFIYTADDGREMNQHSNVLFLLGADKKDTYVDAERLRAGAGGWGCKDMPSIGRREMSRAYMELIKRKTIPGAFALIHPPDISFPLYDDEWNNSKWGNEAQDHANRIYIRIGSEPGQKMAFMTIPSSADSIKPLKLKIV